MFDTAPSRLPLVKSSFYGLNPHVLRDTGGTPAIFAPCHWPPVQHQRVWGLQPGVRQLTVTFNWKGLH